MHLYLKPLSRLFIAACFISLAGCVSQPRKVVASVPLVTKYSTEKPNKQMIPEQYWTVLSDNVSSKLTHPQYDIKLHHLYISALGEKCRELEIATKDTEMQKRIACELHFLNAKGKQDKAWFFEPEIIKATSYIEL